MDLPLPEPLGPVVELLVGVQLCEDLGLRRFNDAHSTVELLDGHEERTVVSAQ